MRPWGPQIKVKHGRMMTRLRLDARWGQESLDLLRVRSNCRRGEYVLQRGRGRSVRHHRSLRAAAARLAQKERGIAEMSAKFRASGGEVYVAGD